MYPFLASSSTLSKISDEGLGTEVAVYCRAKPQWLAIFSACRPVGVQNKRPRSDVRSFTQKMSHPLSALQSHLKQSNRSAITLIHHIEVGVLGVSEHCSNRNAAEIPHARNIVFPISHFWTDFAAEESTCGPCRLNRFRIDLLSSSLSAYWLRILYLLLTHVDLHSLSSELWNIDALLFYHDARQQP